MTSIRVAPGALAALAIVAGATQSQELKGDSRKADDFCNIVSVDLATNEILVEEIATALRKALTLSSTDVAYAFNPACEKGIYCAQVFAAPE
jgi:hypothetical protein